MFSSLSLYAQDEWKLTKRLTLTYGLRWELNPPPAVGDGPDPLAVTQVADPTQLALAPPGTSLWRTTFGNFAPRAGFAYQLSDKSGRETVLRGAVGVFYDLAHDQAGDVFADSFPFLAGGSLFNTPFPSGLTGVTQTSGGTTTVPFSAFDPKLKAPLLMAVESGCRAGPGKLADHFRSLRRISGKKAAKHADCIQSQSGLRVRETDH